MVVFAGVSPIGDTDISALPIQDFDTAIGFYTQMLGFTLVEQDADKVILRRDDARIGLSKNDADPEQASCYFSVSDVAALREELDAKGIAPGPLRMDEYGGKRYQVFFAKEPYGVCFCFGQQL